jgi:hypothetical protein
MDARDVDQQPEEGMWKVVTSRRGRYSRHVLIGCIGLMVTRRWAMSLHEIELTVGDVLQIGEFTVTVIDLENGEVTFRIQEPVLDEEATEGATSPRPR